jgi:hypothetical protein
MSIQTYVVPNDLPAPTASATTVTFTDVYGEQWVAKSSVASGAWRKARDVLHAVIYRNTTLAMPSGAGTFIAYDTVLRDTYGMFSSNGFSIPAAGWYRIQATCNSNTTAAGQYIQGGIWGGPAAGTNIAGSNSVTATAGGLSMRVWIETVCAVNDLIKAQFYINIASQNLQLGQSNARLEISYIGTG